MNQKGNWYIKLRTTKRCDMIKKKRRVDVHPHLIVVYKDRFGTPIKFVNISFRYKYYYKLCWKFYKSWKNPVHHDVNEFRCTSRPWTVENHYKVKIEQYVSTCISVYFGIHAQSARVRVTCKRCREEKNFVGSSCPLIFWLFRHLENFLLEKNH